MRRLLLVSSSTVHGSGYLDHCAEPARRLFAGTRRVLFVPYALADRDGYAARAMERFAALGLGLESVHRRADPARLLGDADGVFVGGGNTFRLLERLWASGLVPALRERVAAGMPYMGTSAGSNVACPTIMTTNDMPIVAPPTFEALDLVPFQINPHYLDADPASTHKGETREQRLAEFLEENDLPVVALREGSWLEVEGGATRLGGSSGGRLFGRSHAPRELPPGCDVGAELASSRAAP